MKEALKATLVKQMRAKFANPGDEVGEDVIGEEVGAFMTDVGSVRDDEMSSLESRIARRLRGATNSNADASEVSRSPRAFAPRDDPPPSLNGRRRFGPGGVQDEWAEISKWNSREGERLRAESLAKKRENQKAMAAALAEQMKAKTDQKLAQLEAKRLYKVEEDRRLEEWKREELDKIQSRSRATEKLKEERRAQMRDKNDRLRAQQEAKRVEEESLRKALAAQYRRKMIEDVARAEAIKAETEKLRLSNERTLKIREEQRKKEAEDDVMYQKLYAEKLRKQEDEYLANIQAVKDKQNTLTGSVNLNEPVSERRYYADEMIAENARIADQKMADRENRDAERKRALARNTELELAKQIRAKQERLDRERAEAKRRHLKFAKVVEALDAVEKTSLAEARARRVEHLAMLEAQMRDNQTRKTVFPMTETERKMNSGLLARVHQEREQAA